MARRRRLHAVTPVALAVFVAGVAAPRAGLLLHHHHGGDAAHVHLDGDADGLDDDFPGAHAPLHPGEVALRATDDDVWHGHASQPFQRGTPAARAAVVAAGSVTRVAAAAAREAGARSMLVRQARAPPAPVRSIGIA